MWLKTRGRPRVTRVCSSVMAWVLVVSSARAVRADDENAPPRAVRASFVTSKSVDEVRADACTLTGAFQVAGRARTWEVTVGNQRCSSLPVDADAVPLHITIADAAVTVEDAIELRRTVTLEATAADIPEDTLQRVVTSTGIALRDKRPAPAIAGRGATQPSTGTTTSSSSNLTGVAVGAAAAGGAAIIIGVVVAAVVLVGALLAALFAASNAIKF